jgi:hypothetical protein
MLLRRGLGGGSACWVGESIFGWMESVKGVNWEHEDEK